MATERSEHNREAMRVRPRKRIVSSKAKITRYLEGYLEGIESLQSGECQELF